jgi:hypothetical protein
MKEPQALVCTRLVDMTTMHPNQIEKTCYKCGQLVGIYPTGQRALDRYPDMQIKCVNCAIMQPADEIYSAGTADEIAQERRDSKPVIIQ